MERLLGSGKLTLKKTQPLTSLKFYFFVIYVPYDVCYMPRKQDSDSTTDGLFEGDLKTKTGSKFSVQPWMMGWCYVSFILVKGRRREPSYKYLVLCQTLTYFFPEFPLEPLGTIRKLLVSDVFRGRSKGKIGKKWVNWYF